MVPTTNGPGGEKTQPTGTVLEDVEFVVVLEVRLLEVVEAMVEEVVVEELDIAVVDVEDVEEVEVGEEPPNLIAMLAPRAITTMTRTARATAILPIP
ncbi:MAG TPA: hypothetical protein VGS04_03700 [Nitrososphaerales archaeon]|nr:hypothetical protein [Nitrososphaerales archaeon]